MSKVMSGFASEMQKIASIPSVIGSLVDANMALKRSTASHVLPQAYKLVKGSPTGKRIVSKLIGLPEEHLDDALMNRTPREAEAQSLVGTFMNNNPMADMMMGMYRTSNKFNK
jgi:hypothetical protein